MNRIRCSLFAAIVVLSSVTCALGGVIQGPAKSEPSPPPTALTTVSTSGGLPQPASTEELELVWPDATTMLMELLLTIF